MGFFDKDHTAKLSDLKAFNEALQVNFSILSDKLDHLTALVSGNGHKTTLERIKEFITIPETPGLSDPVKELSYQELVTQYLVDDLSKSEPMKITESESVKPVVAARMAKAMSGGQKRKVS